MNQIPQHSTLKEPLTLHIDITGQVDKLPGQASMAANVYLPPDEVLQNCPSLTFITLIHGGTYTRRYWDLVVPGYGRDDYSFARYLARQGHCVLTLDNLGMGESRTILNGFDLKTIMMAHSIVAAANTMKEMLSHGDLVEGIQVALPFSVLIGHSMGGYLTALAQTKFHSFNAIVIQGEGGGAKKIAGLDESAKQLFVPDANGYIAPHRKVFFPFFHGLFSPPADVVAQDDAYGVATPTTLFMEVFQRKVSFTELAQQIDVPILLTFGESDSIISPFGELDLYTASPSRSVYILKGSAHCHNFAPTRNNLWQVISQFVAWAYTFATNQSPNQPHLK